MIWHNLWLTNISHVPTEKKKLIKFCLEKKNCVYVSVMQPNLKSNGWLNLVPNVKDFIHKTGV